MKSTTNEQVRMDAAAKFFFHVFEQGDKALKTLTDIMNDVEKSPEARGNAATSILKYSVETAKIIAQTN